jgi:hypothetical protein
VRSMYIHNTKAHLLFISINTIIMINARNMEISKSTMTQGSTKPLTNEYLGVKAVGAWGWRPNHSQERTVYKFWESQPPDAHRAWPDL